MPFAELVEGYKLTYDKFGITAQRQFLEYDEESGGPAESGVTIPVIGDLFHNPVGEDQEEWQNCFCVKTEQQYAGRDKRKLLVTCYYSNEPIDNSNMKLDYTPPTSIDALPQDYDYGGEYQLFKVDPKNQPNNYWTWEDGGDKIAQAIPFRIRTYGHKVNRIIGGSAYTAFVELVRTMMGKVNDDIWQDGGAGCWLFVGARSEIFNDQRSEPAYRFELSFSYRDPDGSNENGWQKILSERGSWRIPITTDPARTASPYLYETADFSELFSTAAEE